MSTPSAVVVTDLTIYIPSSDAKPDTQTWHRIDKNLILDKSPRKAWLYVALAHENTLKAEDLVVIDISVGAAPPDPGSRGPWEERPGGIWVLKGQFSGMIDQAVTQVDVLFGADAVDPRPQWVLISSFLQLDGNQEAPAARLTVLRGRAEPIPAVRPALRVRENGKFKIVQISDMHMVTGVGECNDAIDAQGKDLPASDADTLTVDFVGSILDVEKPDLVVLTGDQLHHDIFDSQTALFKAVAPIIERSIPFAVVFGNHDSEGEHALPRSAQMLILQNLPLSLCNAGQEDLCGTGNYYLEVRAREPSQSSLSTLYFLDSHAGIRSNVKTPDYDCIKPSQINWFAKISQDLRKKRENDKDNQQFHQSLAFQHIPLPEFGDPDLRIYSGNRGEPTEGPSFNSRFYDALAKEGVSVLACGHDHVNDFCALLPPQMQQNGDITPHTGPWLCYAGCVGFGGYCSYDGKRYHRRSRVWELNTRAESLKTWLRVEYREDRVDELALVENGVIPDK
ncbi:hypothetical protein V3481_017075 [Fusarium oxysporum f. sp. vasinfectum]|uniref:Calcineurin-like phosphoesterase domain-containing protein n=1 Tax=Fusarium oxysporum f. sp. vasinfectum 25433 TaxID=1089449 RepID=X0L0B8_FUSOX|nr:hypothetical protein FOTG_17090 [Fusarium oxysporum f. sp. vasinfectum 25433]